jgi:hypothetical protein
MKEKKLMGVDEAGDTSPANIAGNWRSRTYVPIFRP